MTSRIIVADALVGLASLEAESVQCVVTSPPYWGLRDYGVAGQLGLEATPAEYLRAMARVFRAVRQVLRKDGTLWLNMGDCYMGGGRGGGAADSKQRTNVGSLDAAPNVRAPGLKAKDLVGMPWRLAFALQRQGWWLRSDIVWEKPNPMPESVRDRPTRAHEYLFLMTRGRRYLYDAAAIAEPSESGQPPQPVSGWAAGAGPHHAIAHNTGTNGDRYDRSRPLGPKLDAAPGDSRSTASARMGRGAGWRAAKNAEHPEQNSHRRLIENTAAARAAGGTHDSPFGAVRNKRTVWTIATQAYPEAHFATFPEALVEPCILAGSRRGDVVLDPFAGSGTVGLVTHRHGGPQKAPHAAALRVPEALRSGLVRED